MGLTPQYLRFIESAIEQVLGKDVLGLHMLELGDQVISEQDVPEKTGKEYFTQRGFQHTSVDINGLHGAMVRDLTKPQEFQDWHGKFDVITNSGTTEHVEPFASQYECFGIIHDCLKVGGIAIHLIPDVVEHDKHGAWKYHCYNYYSSRFFEMLARECQYELLANTVINGLRGAAVRKVKDVPFMDNRATFLKAIARRNMANKFLRQIGLGRWVRQIG
jgi:hypothetical protein